MEKKGFMLMMMIETTCIIDEMIHFGKTKLAINNFINCLVLLLANSD